jgi:hypothetical protein
VIHTMELILGVQPDYLQVALAPPLYNAFTSTPDLTPYNAVPISQSLLDEQNGATAPMATISSQQVWQSDRVNPNLANQIDWAYRYGIAAACPQGVGADHNNPCRVAPGAARDH